MVLVQVAWAFQRYLLLVYAIDQLLITCCLDRWCGISE